MPYHQQKAAGSDLDYISVQTYQNKGIPSQQSNKQRRTKTTLNKTIDKLSWDKVNVLPETNFDESKYPPWLFKKKENPIIKILTQDAEEDALRKKIGNPYDFDLQLAEYRARKLEKDLGLNIKRTGKDIYHSGGSFMTEMNLYNAGRPLAQLIDKVEKTILTIDNKILTDENSNNSKTPSKI